MQSSMEAIRLWVEVLETQVTLVSLIFPFNTPILCFELIGQFECDTVNDCEKLNFDEPGINHPTCAAELRFMLRSSECIYYF